MAKLYTIAPAAVLPEPGSSWDGPAWSAASTLDVDNFHARSSDHRPSTHVRMLYTPTDLYVSFAVQDQYVRCRHTGYQQMVCEDSCVELFLQPVAGKGYFNVEVNCGGTLLLYYVEDATPRAGGDYERYTVLKQQQLEQVRIYHSLPAILERDIAEPTQWRIDLAIPWRLFEPHVGKVVPVAGASVRGNCYKCADMSSHPHWASWSPIGAELNFHQPAYFGTLTFG